jgi:hypothetical protein
MIVEIPLRTSLDTMSDPEEIGQNASVQLDNFDLSNPGILKLRKGKVLSCFLDEVLCDNMERCSTSKGKFFIGYDSNSKKIFRINKF